MKQYKYPVCNGDLQFDTACRHCEKCIDEMKKDELTYEEIDACKISNASPFRTNEDELTYVEQVGVAHGFEGKEPRGIPGGFKEPAEDTTIEKIYIEDNPQNVAHGLEGKKSRSQASTEYEYRLKFYEIDWQKVPSGIVLDISMHRCFVDELQGRFIGMDGLYCVAYAHTIGYDSYQFYRIPKGTEIKTEWLKEIKDA